MPHLQKIIDDLFRTKSWTYATSENRLDIQRNFITAIAEATAERMRYDLIRTYGPIYKQDKAEVLDRFRRTPFPDCIELWLKDSHVPKSWQPTEGWGNAHEIIEAYIGMRNSHRVSSTKVPTFEIPDYKVKDYKGE